MDKLSGTDLFLPLDIIKINESFDCQCCTDCDNFCMSRTTDELTEPRMIVEGFVATSDYDGRDIFSPNCLKKLVNDLKRYSTILFNHQKDGEPVGKVIDAKFKDGALWIKALISSAGEIAKKIRTWISLFKV